MAKSVEFRVKATSDDSIEVINTVKSVVQKQYDGQNIEFIKACLNCLETNSGSLALSTEEQELVNKAVEKSGMSFDEILKRGLLAEASKLEKQSDKLGEYQDLTYQELEKLAQETTIKGIATLKIQKCIELIEHHNNHCQLTADKIFISPTVVFKVTNSNRASINSYFEEHQEQIDKLNSKHKLEASINRKGKGYDVKATLGV